MGSRRHACTHTRTWEYNDVVRVVKLCLQCWAVAEAAEAATVGQSLDAAEAAATQGIRELYHIQHEFTDEDRVQVLAENPWVEGVPAPPAPSAAAGGGGAAEVEAK